MNKKIIALGTLAIGIAASLCLIARDGGHGGGHGGGMGGRGTAMGSGARSAGMGGSHISSTRSGSFHGGNRGTGISHTGTGIRSGSRTAPHGASRISPKTSPTRSGAGFTKRGRHDGQWTRHSSYGHHGRHGYYWRHHRNWYPGNFWTLGWGYPWWWDRRVCIDAYGFEAPFQFCFDQPDLYYWWYR